MLRDVSVEATELLLPVVSVEDVEGVVLAVLLDGLLLLVLLVSLAAVVLELDGVVLDEEGELEGLVASVSPVEVEDDGELVLAVELDGLVEDESVLEAELDGDEEEVPELVPDADPLTPKLPEAPDVLEVDEVSGLAGVVLE